MMKSHDLAHELASTAAVFGRNKEVSLVFEGNGAYTDGQEIVLPAMNQGTTLSHDEVMVFRGYLDHEAGHVRHTDFEVLKKFASTCSDQAKAIHNCLEDMWLEQRVMAEYPGARKNLVKLNETVGAEELTTMTQHPEVFQKVTADAVCSAILRAGRKDYGGEPNDKMYSLLPKRFQAWGDKWAEQAHNAKNTQELCNLALAIEKLLEETSSSADMSKDQPKGGGKGLEGDPADFDFDPNGDVTESKPERKGQANGQLKDGKGKKMLTKSLNEQMAEWIKSTEDAYLDAHGKKSDKYRVLSTRNDEVYERGKPARQSSPIHNSMNKLTGADYENIRSGLTGVVNVMKTRLRRALMAREMRDWDFAREVGRLDTKRLTAGVLGASNVYKVRKDRMEMDTAVHFLVDLSGSMGGDKIQVATEAVVAFCECLEGTQIKYQVTGFSNYGSRPIDPKPGSSYERTDPLKLHKFKKFEEPLQPAKGAIAAIREAAGGCNSDRDAVLWAYHELKKRPEKRKVLFVLSDGQPANSMHNSNVDLTHALKKAVDEITRSSVECVGIGILDRTVKSIYPKATTINKVEDLSGAIFTQLSNLLTGGKVVF